ncbi:MAG: hypothetical protein K6E20_01760 [Acholeplasmatales bacterium]|nr:hypothetical protein [Acholeplasmatales bacterium]
MRIKRISGILIGSTALVVSSFALTSCGGSSIEFKKYSNESTKEEFEKAYATFCEEKKTNGYDLTIYDYESEESKSDGKTSKMFGEQTTIETFDSVSNVLYRSNKETYEAEAPYESESSKVDSEYIYQSDNNLNTIVDLKTKTYSSTAYNASASSLKKASISFGEFIDVNYYQLSNYEKSEAYTIKYYNDSQVYTIAISYDYTKDKFDEDSNYKVNSMTFDFIFQFYGIDSEYYVGYKTTRSSDVTYTSDSKTYNYTQKIETARYARLFNVTQTLEKVDLSGYKKDYSSYANN